MKTISRIIVILLVASVVAGAFSLSVNNMSISAGLTEEGGQPPAVTSTDGQSMQPMERPEGGASITGGLSGVIATLAKLTVITIIVLLAQKGFSLLGNLKLRPVQR